jgi:hypothetical protein
MRKELVVFIPSSETGVEVSVRNLKEDSKYVLIDHDGHKMAILKKEMISAINEIDDFYTINGLPEIPFTGQVNMFVENDTTPDYGSMAFSS